MTWGWQDNWLHNLLPAASPSCYFQLGTNFPFVARMYWPAARPSVHYRTGYKLHVKVRQYKLLGHSGCRGMAPLILNISGSELWVVSLNLRGTTPVRIRYKVEWAPESIWGVLEAKNIPFPYRDSNPGPPKPQSSHFTVYAFFFSGNNEAGAWT